MCIDIFRRTFHSYMLAIAPSPSLLARARAEGSPRELEPSCVEELLRCNRRAQKEGFYFKTKCYTTGSHSKPPQHAREKSYGIHNDGGYTIGVASSGAAHHDRNRSKAMDPES